MKKALRVWLLAAVAAAAASCSDPEGAVALGRWGGPNAELVVTAAGASARFKCGATGTIAQRLVLDENSSFDVPGSFQTPIVNAGVQPARYLGAVSGSDMSLVLFIAGERAGIFPLRQGADATFDVCNF